MYVCIKENFNFFWGGGGGGGGRGMAPPPMYMAPPLSRAINESNLVE